LNASLLVSDWYIDVSYWSANMGEAGLVRMNVLKPEL
jgi:hypothetical protein